MRKFLIGNNACIKRCVLFSVIIILIIQGTILCAQQQDPLQQSCLTLEQIFGLIEKKVDQNIIIENVEKYGTNIEMDYNTAVRLARVGAIDKLIEAIKNNPCAAISITAPKDGAECGAVVKLAGKSKNFPGKFLWAFTHVKYLKDKWWPQVGAIDIDEGGSWQGMAYLGSPQDIGFDFEIVVMWVDENVHQMLKEYLNKGDQTGNYPPMSLPDGSPSAKVVIKKIKQ
ncbi:MAG TPA: hypothetical protein VK186_28375 [Candidatus Deferrimicrobium sp.]|nr:hypothetical protein [Candidatus Deferrimicrobium sp.]